MSNCIEDLNDYDLVKRYFNCGNILLKSNFHKRSKSEDGFYPQSIFC